MQHEALFKISKLLDQFKDGLNQAKMLKIIQNFPERFSPLFICEGSVTADNVISALCTSDRDTITVGFLHQYIRALSEKGIIYIYSILRGRIKGQKCTLFSIKYC